MFLLRSQFAFAVHRFKSKRKITPRLGWLNNFVDEAPSSGNIGVGKCLAILFDQLLTARGLVVRGFDFMAKNNFGCAFGSHHRDLRSRPRHHAVCTETFGAHGDVCAAIGLAQDHRDLGNRGSRIGKKEFGAVANDATAFLLNSRKKSRHIDKGQQRNIECIAEAHEARCLVGCVDVEHTRHRAWLVGDNTYWPPLQVVQSR